MTRSQVPFFDIEGVLTFPMERFQDKRGNSIKLNLLSRQEISGTQLSTILISENLGTGIIRGLHFQIPPFQEEKYISCTKGKIFDVIVDLRQFSETYLKWASIELSESDNFGLILPEGVAHGYQSLTNTSSVVYHLTSSYSHEHAISLSFRDPNLGINWPLALSEASDFDLNGMALDFCANAYNRALLS